MVCIPLDGIAISGAFELPIVGAISYSAKTEICVKVRPEVDFKEVTLKVKISGRATLDLYFASVGLNIARTSAEVSLTDYTR